MFIKFLKKRWYALIIVLLIGGVFVYQSKFAPAKFEKEKAYVVKTENTKDTLSLSGKIDAEEKASLSFQSAGRLAWVGVKEGDVVNKNQLIAALDQRDIKKRLQKYLNTYSTARSQFDQKQDDNTDSSILGLTDDQRRAALRLGDQAQYNLNNAVLDVELQNLALEYSNLYSPISGVVTHIDVPYAGENITPTNATFQIINPDSIYFSALADQTDVVKLDSGMSGEITFDSFPDNMVNGTINKIAFTPKEGETGTVYEVNININDQNRRQYRLGMTGDIEFTLRERPNVISIPSTYIKEENGKKYILKEINGQKVKTFIETGEIFDTTTEITSGLHENDIIYD